MPKVSQSPRGPRSPDQKWSRTGCNTCKKRRKKCDESKPRCNTCQRLGLVCEGYKSLWIDAVDQHAPQSRDSRRIIESVRVTTKANSPLTIDGSSDTAQDRHGPSMIYEMEKLDAADVLQLGTGNEDWSLFDGQLSPIQQTSCPAIHHNPFESHPGEDKYSSSQITRWEISKPLSILQVSARSSFYLQYHIEQLCPILVMLDAPTNPLRSPFLTIASSSAMLMHAICAVSACHMAQRSKNNNTQLSVAAISYYTHAVNELNTLLSTFKGSNDDHSDVTLLTTVFLCKYEIVNGSTKLWRNHLLGLESLLHTYVKRDKVHSQVYRFVRSFVTYHSSIATITNLYTDVTSLIEYPHPNLASAVHEDSLGRLDPYMGFTEHILRAFTNISAIARNRGLYEIQPKQLEADINSVKAQLDSWTCSMISYTVPEGVTTKNLQDLELVATSYRYAAYVYLNSTLEDLTCQLSLDRTDYRLIYSKKQSITLCLDVMELVSGGSGCEAALVLPLFLTGCETDSPTQVGMIVRRLMMLEQNIGIGNIRRARQVVQSVWSSAAELEGKRSWQSIVQELGWDLILT